YLDPKNPMTFGALGDPSVYTEYRYLQDKAMENALSVIEKTSMEFNDMYGRYYGGLIDGYKLDDAEIVIAAMGSIIGTLKDSVDELRSKGTNAGILKIRSFRPFPKKDVRRIAKSAGIIVAIDKNISLGTGEGALCTEIKACLHSAGIDTPVFGSMLGHGGRDVSKEVIEKLVYRAGDMMKHGLKEENEFTDLRRELL
ncbi:pyruvate:ferredoxin oxidoreductase, alpha subunit, partial [groundwater metagenome]